MQRDVDSIKVKFYLMMLEVRIVITIFGRQTLAWPP